MATKATTTTIQNQFSSNHFMFTPFYSFRVDGHQVRSGLDAGSLRIDEKRLA
jgi:hypothetical protein